MCVCVCVCVCVCAKKRKIGKLLFRNVYRTPLPCVVVDNRVARLHQFLIDGLKGHVDDRHSSQLKTGSGVAHLTVQRIH